MLCCTQEKHYRFYVQKQKNCDNVTPNAVHIFSSVISDGRFSCAMILPSDDWEIPDSCDNLYLLIKWCQPRTTGNKNTFGSFPAAILYFLYCLTAISFYYQWKPRYFGLSLLRRCQLSFWISGKSTH